MKDIQIKRSSWHYWVASNLGGWNRRRETDFCDYIRHVILAVIALGLYLLAAVLYLWSGYDWVVWVHGALFHGSSEHMPKFARLFVTVSGVALFVGCAIVIAFGVEHLKYCLEERAYQRRLIKSKRYHVAAVPKEPSFLQHAYRSLKDKVCFHMNIVD